MGGRGREGGSRAKPGNQLVYMGDSQIAGLFRDFCVLAIEFTF